MSLNKKHELIEIAKVTCRELRKKSTKAERLFWEEVRNRKFFNKKFYRQYPIFHDVTGKESFFIADFFCNEDKLVVELDGSIHKYRLTQDEWRTEILNYLGLQVIRFSNDEVENKLDEVMKKLQSELIPLPPSL